MLTEQEKRQSWKDLCEFLKDPSLQKDPITGKNFSNNPYAEDLSKIKNPVTRKFIERLILLNTSSDGDLDICKVVLEIRSKLARGEKMTNKEADFLLNKVKAKYFSGDLDISGYEFNQLDLDGVEIKGKLIDNNVIIHRSENDKEAVLKAVTENGIEEFKYILEKFRDDKEIVMAAIRSSTNWVEDGEVILGLASKRLQDDKEVLITMFEQFHGQALKYASKRLQDDKDVVMAAVINSFGEALEYASSRLQDDEEIVMAAVCHNGNTLKYASKRLQDNEKIILTAIIEPGISNSLFMEYVSKRLQNNKKIALAAVSRNPVELEFVSPRLKKDKDILIVALENSQDSFTSLDIEDFIPIISEISTELKSDNELIRAAINRDPRLIYYLGGELCSKKRFELFEHAKNKEEIDMNKKLEKYLYLKNTPSFNTSKIYRRVALRLVERYGETFQYLSDELKDDKNIVLAAIKKHNGIDEFVEQVRQGGQYFHELKFLRLKEFNISKLKNTKVLPYASTRLKDDKEVVMAAVKQDGWALGDASTRLKDNEEVVMAAVKQDGGALEYASTRLKDNEEVVMAAVKQDGLALDYASPRLKNNEKIVSTAKNKEIDQFLSSIFRQNYKRK